MSYTRDWLNTTPLDHSKFKDQPGSVRNAKVDVEERLAAFIYGFTSGETESGFKYAPFIVQGTAPSSATNQIILHGSDVNSVCELWVVDEAGNRMQLTSAGKSYLAGGGKLPNNVYLVAVDSTGTGTVNLLKCTTGNVLSLLGGVTVDGTGNITVPGAAAVGSLTIGGTGPNTALGWLKADSDGFLERSNIKSHDSGWFSATTGTTYTKAHSLGTTKCIVAILMSEHSDGSGVCNNLMYDHEHSYGATMYALSTTQIQIKTASSQIFFFEGSNYASGYLRILMLAL